MTPFETESPDEPVIEQKSRWEDTLDVFLAPRDLFERRKHDKFGPPLIILLVLATAFYYILLPAQGMILRAAMPPEMLAKAGKMMNIMSIAAGIMTPITYAIMIGITAGILWLLGKLVDSDASYPEMMLVATYGGYIFLIGSIAGLVAAMVHGADGLDPVKHMSFGVMRFLDAASMPAVLTGLLARMNIFAIWQAIVWMIGFQVVTGVTRSKAAMVAAGTWFLFAVPSMLGGGVASKMGNVQIKTGD